MSLILAFSVACAGTHHTRVLVPYAPAEPIREVTLEVTNATGRDLPLPPAGVIELAVRAVTKQAEADASIVDVFARAATDDLSAAHLAVAATSTAPGPRLRIGLEGWDVADNGANGAVVFVTADYQLLDAGAHVLWHVRQDGLSVRLTGPNLSRSEVARIARVCLDLAFASLGAH